MFEDTKYHMSFLWVFEAFRRVFKDFDMGFLTNDCYAENTGTPPSHSPKLLGCRPFPGRGKRSRWRESVVAGAQNTLKLVTLTDMCMVWVNEGWSVV